MPHRAGGPVPEAARQGRDHQKYGSNGERLVAGSIPVRFLPGVEGPAGVQVLMVTTRGGQSLVFPKGGWETDETVETAAQRETMEEAGVRGELEGPMLGAFPFHSNKAERLQTAHRGRCIAHVFVLRVTEELAVWPEGKQRQRFWVPLHEAASHARDEWMREALAAFVKRCGWEEAVMELQQQQQQAAGAVEAATAASPAGTVEQKQAVANGSAATVPAPISQAAAAVRT